MVAYATTSYNTGYMHGDIKGAFLSDTDTTNASVSARNLITNSTFDSDVNNWTGATNGVLTNPSNRLRITNTGGANGRAISNTFSTTVGKRYIIRADLHDWNTGSTQFRIEIRQSGNDLVPISGTSTKQTGFEYQLTSAGTGQYYVELYCLAGDGNWVEYDNVYVFEAEQDRSVYGKGLSVYGTITKSAVATGAELVAYGPFSDSNYLKQPYNSNLNFGTGAFSIMFWIKSATHSAYSRIMNRVTDVANNRVEFYSDSGTNLVFYTRHNASATSVTVGNGSLILDQWQCCLLYTSPSPRDLSTSRMPSSA